MGVAIAPGAPKDVHCECVLSLRAARLPSDGSPTLHVSVGDLRLLCCRWACLFSEGVEVSVRRGAVNRMARALQMLLLFGSVVHVALLGCGVAPLTLVLLGPIAACRRDSAGLGYI